MRSAYRNRNDNDRNNNNGFRCVRDVERVPGTAWGVPASREPVMVKAVPGGRFHFRTARPARARARAEYDVGRSGGVVARAKPSRAVRIYC